ncbi:TPA_asm: coat protein [ssRNA phage SRR7976300_9]|uniref:Coat protein n=1 Tax=ssRNA phage SRR7976300_9 TaxID=2786658 RepID=A0A8S5L0U1_9VIRU|nr:coat protein [ssRNA phage SRR7976300_9]DAD51091.1 TPA_asm: coat protein [ssRNA phage SRR7976300_9]
MQTAYAQFADNGNSRTYTGPSHTIAKPDLLIQKRKVPTNINGVSEMSSKIVVGSTDASNAPLAQRISIEVVVRVPVGAQTADVDAAKTRFADLSSDTAFLASFVTQNFVV